MPFLKHGMGGDCDGQPDDERAEDEAHGVTGKWIRERVLNGKTNRGSRELRAKGLELADKAGEMAAKTVGPALTRASERRLHKREILAGSVIKRSQMEAAKERGGG